VSEVLGLTAGGMRRAQNPKIGIDVVALVRGKGEHTIGKPIWPQPSGGHVRRQDPPAARIPASFQSSSPMSMSWTSTLTPPPLFT